MKVKTEKEKSRGYTIVKNEKKSYSNGDYERLGKRLRCYDNRNEIPFEDLEILQTLRTSYKTPLSIIFGILQKNILKVNKKAIVTYRVKRIDSIISKLKRLEDAQLHRLEDIAGCRCILKNNDEVYALKKRLDNELYIKSDRNDYIANPKTDGYRSLHLIVQTKDRSCRPIEIQPRCEKDHNWATLVEITDQIYNTKIKELGNEAELGRLLLLTSKGLNNLNKCELSDLIEIIKRKDFIGKMNGVFINNSIKVRKKWSEIEGKIDKNFFLIQVDKENNSSISRYNNFTEAERAYFEKFKINSESNIVLTHIPNAKFEQISKAYSNYTLTYHDFFQDLLSLLQKLVKESFIKNNIQHFCAHFELFTTIYFELAKLQLLEMYVLKSTKCKGYKKIEWEADINQRLNKAVFKRRELFIGTIVNTLNLYHLIISYKRNRIWSKYSKEFKQSINKLVETSASYL